MPQDRLSSEWAATQARRFVTDEEWIIAMINYRRGVHVNGTVLSQHPFGFFVRLCETVTGLVEGPFIKDSHPGEVGYADDLPAVGTEVEAVVLGLVEHNRQVALSVRPSELARDRWQPECADD